MENKQGEKEECNVWEIEKSEKVRKCHTSAKKIKRQME